MVNWSVVRNEWNDIILLSARERRYSTSYVMGVASDYVFLQNVVWVYQVWGRKVALGYLSFI